jgi:macrolide-specific efflux system membrane fusion protein
MIKVRLTSILIVMLAIVLSSCAAKEEAKLETVKVTRGDVLAVISSTGIVMPRNRLEIKPPVAGRIEDVLVREGENVTKGQVLAWMSSNERAALLDAARSKGEAEQNYWKDVYKPAPIMAPLNGFIIQRNVEPGQSVSVSDSVLVMADRLIVKAQVDETDLGRIKLGQKVEIALDAYPDQKIGGTVEHIAYESKTVSNVVIYEIDVLPSAVPAFFRSGMSATVNFTLSERKAVLVLPLNAVKKRNGNPYVFIKKKDEKDPKPVRIESGQENTENIEIVSGLSEGDEVIIPTTQMVQSAFERMRGIPFNPFGGQRR